MIPFFRIPVAHLGPLEVDAFGVLVSLGFVLGASLAARRARAVGLSPVVVYDLALLCLIFGMVGAHVVHVLAYTPEVLLERPWALLQVWAGISSYGGFAGAGLAILIYLRRKRIPFLSYADTMMFGFFPGWVLGRLGCSTAHDHPGRLTDFFLAVAYPGGARHDLGFYEMLLSLLVWTPLVYVLGRRKGRPPGAVFAALLVAYAVPRFFLDFLRATDLPHVDARYFGLTPAQYAGVALTVWGLMLSRRVNRGKSAA